MTQAISCHWTISDNFGDRIGPYLLSKITGKQVIWCEPNSDFEFYVVGGSILNHINDRGIVWGAGLGNLTDGINPQASIKSVRGPYTRARALSLGVQCPEVYGDPGLLLPRFYTPQSERGKYDVGIVPHYVDGYRAFNWFENLHFIDVFQPIEKVIDEITSCKRIVSSSLHGIVVAHAYGIPAMWLKISDSIGGDGTKYRDHFASVGMEHVINPIDVREKKGMVFGHFTDCPDINTERLWRACPVNQEFRLEKYRTKPE